MSTRLSYPKDNISQLPILHSFSPSSAMFPEPWGNVDIEVPLRAKHSRVTSSRYFDQL